VLEKRQGRGLSSRDAQARGEAATAEIQPAAQQQERAGWGLEYDLHETDVEVEQTSFTAESVIKTVHGKELTFSYELEMERRFHSKTTVSERAGDARLNDPLVINFGGTAAQLTDTRYAFNLNADGKQDQVSWVRPNSGFPALDKNGNGTIDDGSELFGAKTGNGLPSWRRTTTTGMAGSTRTTPSSTGSSSGRNSATLTCMPA
jgi:hypothetical protein